MLVTIVKYMCINKIIVGVLVFNGFYESPLHPRQHKTSERILFYPADLLMLTESLNQSRWDK